MRLFIKNIGKIKEADIEINGITVIGGENNTGKSTVGKSLFAIFNSFYEIQMQIRRERFLSIKNLLQLIYRNTVFSSFEQMKSMSECVEDILAKVEVYKKEPGILREDLHAMFNDEMEKVRRFSEKKDIDDIADRMIAVLQISDETIFESVVSKKMSAEFKGQLLNIYSKEDGIILLNIKGNDLGIKVSDDSVFVNGMDYSLHTEAVYIDDPFVLDDMDFRVNKRKPVYSGHREQLMYKLIQKEEDANVVDEIVVESKFEKIYEKLMTVCGGDIVRQKNGRLGYLVKNADQPLSVDNLSTGLKTFVILKTLLTNGVIETNGTIILDEPEIHLHPEWQLLFAELIVLLNKEFSVNILLNTHSPYFLRAIQVYSAKYEISDLCKYYMSEFAEEKEIRLTDVSDNVDKIFAKLATPLQKLEDERWNID